MRSRKTSSESSWRSGGHGAIRLRLAGTARADLAEIDNYSAEQFGDDAADHYVEGFWEMFALLRTHPLAGALKPDLGKQVRCLTHGSHRIFYRVTRDELLILRIIHHARDAMAVLKKAAK